MSGNLRKGLVIVGGLVAAYILVVHYKGTRADFRAGGNAGGNFVKTLQGR